MSHVKPFRVQVHAVEPERNFEVQWTLSYMDPIGLALVRKTKGE